MSDVDLIVVGAGLSGCALVCRLRQLGWGGTIALVEAGRGPGGRTATRRRRDRPDWRLDHGAPGFQLTDPLLPELEPLLKPLQSSGTLVHDQDAVISLNVEGRRIANGVKALPEGGWWRGSPCMAALCEQMLDQAGPAQLEKHWQRRVRWLSRDQGQWSLSDQENNWQLQGSRLVLSGNLLAHPRSLAMLEWRDVPLRSAVPIGMDPSLDQALEHLAECRADVRWNLMLDLPLEGAGLPRQIWLDQDAQQRWGVERLVLQPQNDGRTGLVVHGLHDGSSITPASQPQLLAAQEERLKAALQEMLVTLPALQNACDQASSLGVMRWGAAQPLDHPLPLDLQWCAESAVGFCGDYLEGNGFGRAQGALESGVRLAERLASS